MKAKKKSLTPEQIAAKRHKEQYVVTQMVQLYCKKKHKDLYDRKTETMCPECRELADYAVARSEHCPFMEHKTFCANCTVHCYRPDMRERIRAVMRFSGPRILFYHPKMACWHVITGKREKRRLKKEAHAKYV